MDFFGLLLLQPDAKTEDDITPLLSAVAAGSLACLELLIKVDNFLGALYYWDTALNSILPIM